MDSVQTIIKNIILNFSALSEALEQEQRKNEDRFNYVDNELNKHKSVLKHIADMINEELQ